VQKNTPAVDENSSSARSGSKAQKPRNESPSHARRGRHVRAVLVDHGLAQNRKMEVVMRAFSSQVSAVAGAIAAVVAARRCFPLICLAACCAAVQGTAAIAADLSSLHIKPGLWELTSESNFGRKGKMLYRICVDASVEHIVFDMLTGSRRDERCEKFDAQLSGHTVTVDMQCGTAASSHRVTTFEGDHAAHTRGRVRYVPPMLGTSIVLDSTDAKWAGACPDDMKPGDAIVWHSIPPANVRRWNLLEGLPTPPTVIRGTTPGH
jgi:hypothetical protein